MNNKQMEKLWYIADKLRGTVDVNTLYKIILYGILLKHIEYEKSEIPSFDEKFTLGFLALTYGKITKSEDVIHYIYEIENNMGFDNGILTKSFEAILNRTDDETVRTVFEVINSVDFQSEHECYNLAVAMVNRMTLLSGKYSGESGTNLALAKIEKAILCVEEGMTVYDAFCGTGISVNEASNGKGTVYLQDVNVDAIGVATILTILSGNKIGRINCADSLQNPMGKGMTFDRVICEPPFMPKYSNEYFIQMPYSNCLYQGSLDSESLPLRHALKMLKNDGIAVVLVPMGMLFKSGRVGEIRKKMIEDNLIDAVIELPNGLVPGTMVASALVVFRKNRQDEKIFLFNAKDLFVKVDKKQLDIPEDAVEKIANSYRDKAIIEGMSNMIVDDELSSNGYNLCTTQYVVVDIGKSIEIKDNQDFVGKNKELITRLEEIDSMLETVRGRFVKEA